MFPMLQRPPSAQAKKKKSGDTVPAQDTFLDAVENIEFIEIGAVSIRD